MLLLRLSQGSLMPLLLVGHCCLVLLLCRLQLPLYHCDLHRDLALQALVLLLLLCQQLLQVSTPEADVAG